MRRFARVAAAMLIVAGCGGSTAPDAGAPAPAGGGTTSGPTVTVVNNKFSPDVLTISAGQTVTWKWDACSGGDGYGGGTCVDHKVLFSDGSASPIQSTGTFTKSFGAVGTFTYQCAIHGTIMTGTIVVK